MKISSRGIISRAVFLVLSLSIFASASNDEVVKRIANYKQWSKVSQVLPDGSLLGEQREFLP